MAETGESRASVAEKKAKDLPLGDPPFREIIQGNFLYADKTEYIHRLTEGPKLLFLSRPRRFGKTLLIDTLEELFLGNRELFEGLWIDTRGGYAFERYPVLRFNMAYAEIYVPNDLSVKIKRDLNRAAEAMNVKISGNSYDDMLQELLEGLARQHGVGTVILIDEYDAPVTRHIADRKLSLGNRAILHDFYAAIKKFRSFVRFALVTGITRFAMTSLDSGPNSFTDISLMPEFAGVCGFSVSDLDSLFSGRFEETLRKLKQNGEIHQNADETELKAKILDWYDGYNWLGDEHVLNPYSILNFFNAKTFDEFWTSSGQPSHLTALVRKKPLKFFQPKLDSYTTRQIGKSELGKLAPVPVLFHSGYLTIDRQVLKEVSRKGQKINVKAFTFTTPNMEVDLNYQTSFFKLAFDLDDDDFDGFADQFPNALLKEDSKETARLLHDLLAAVTYFQKESSEKRFHSMLHMAFLASGLEILSEVPTGDGRSDMVVLLDDKVRVVIELKYLRVDGDSDKDDDARAAKELVTALDEAENQILIEDYIAPHRAAGCHVICLALAIRGKDEVAARFFDPEKTERPKDS
ncbi:MAG: ATP-binding protein [Deltaproteobacteria bacterium]|nr:ATP-binding protein [Deltaproteobacteria bacterium]